MKMNQIIGGKVFVTKNPCCHPGDIRLLRAVDKETLMSRVPARDSSAAYEEALRKVEHLTSLVNVIVFNVQADRPEQNKMSGGDLDGDCYHLNYDPALVSELEKCGVYPP
jgi:RNA-dependent RNA polymerase